MSMSRLEAGGGRWEAGGDAQIFVDVRCPGGCEPVAAHDPGDRLGGLVNVLVPCVRHAAEGRHVA
jgi:hypothetical protein